MNRVPIHRNSFSHAPGWVHAVALGAFGVITLVLLVLFWLYRDTDIWHLHLGDAPKSLHAFAEAVRPGIFRTQANTWSNLAYIFVGLYIVAFAWWDARRETSAGDPYSVRRPALMGLYGVACIVLGFGSGLMHASMMSFGHKADVFGMYFTFVALIAVQWGRWAPDVPLGGRRLPTWPILGTLVIAGSYLLLLYDGPLGGAERLLGILVLAITLGIAVDAIRRQTSQQYRWLLLAFVSLVVGGALQRWDVAQRFNPSDSWLQGHAIWHLLTAAMYGFLAYFYRSEAPVIVQSIDAACGQDANPKRASDEILPRSQTRQSP